MEKGTTNLWAGPRDFLADQRPLLRIVCVPIFVSGLCVSPFICIVARGNGLKKAGE